MLTKTRSAVSIFLFSLMLAPADAGLPSTHPGAKAPAPNFVLSDCTAFADKMLTVKFRLDENFDRYISGRFGYPKTDIKDAQIGKLYLITIKDGQAAHNIKSAALIDQENPPKDLTDHDLIGRVVGADDKTIFVEYAKDQNVQRFFSREQVFPMYNPRTFKPGQVIKIVFARDNRHLQGMVVIEEKNQNR